MILSNQHLREHTDNKSSRGKETNQNPPGADFNAPTIRNDVADIIIDVRCSMMRDSPVFCECKKCARWRVVCHLM